MILSIFANRQFQSIALAHLATTFGMNLLLPVLPVFFHSIGFGETEIGLLMGSAAASALLIRPWVGLKVDMNGSRPAILIGQLLLLLSTAGYLGAAGFAALLLLRLLFGLSMAFYGTGAVTFASSVESGENASSAIAMYTFTTMLAIGMGMSISQITFDRFGFSTLTLISLALITFATLIMGLRARPIKPPTGGIRAPFMTVLKTKLVIVTTICQFATNFSFGAVFTFVPLAALDSGISFYSLFFITFAIFVIASRFFVQRINDILGLEKSVQYASLMLLTSVLLLYATISPLTLALSGAIFGLGFGVIFPTLVLLLVYRINPNNRGTGLSILIAAGDTGNALSAALLGGVAEHFGYPCLFMITALLLIGTSWYFYSVGTDDPDQKHAPT